MDQIKWADMNVHLKSLPISDIYDDVMTRDRLFFALLALWWESTGHRRIPLAKGKECGIPMIVWTKWWINDRFVGYFVTAKAYQQSQNYQEHIGANM